MKKIMMTSLVVATTVLLFGCNTLTGIGKDVELTVEKIQEAFRK